MAAHRWNGWTSADRSAPGRPVLDHGRGCEVWDIHGRRYLDGVAAAANTPFGHAHPRLSDAVTAQLGRLAHFDETTAGLRPAEDLMRALGDVTGLNDCVLVNSGSEAIEAAIRITMDYWKARGETQRDTIIAFAKGYHGCTALTQALSGLPILDTEWAASPRMRHVHLEERHHPSCAGAAQALAADFAAAIDAAGSGRVAAVIIEPFLNVGGGIVLPTGFLAELRTLTTDADCLLIVDEVFTGFGRSGSAFATGVLAQPPDILAISKGMAGGIVPMGATCLRRGLRDEFGSAPLRYGHTTSGHGLACAAALATIDLLTTHGLAHAAAATDWFATEFTPRFTGAPGVVEARSYGVVGIVECDTLDRAQTILAHALDAGLILGLKASALMLTPALNATTTELEEMTALLHEAVERARPLTAAGSKTRS